MIFKSTRNFWFCSQQYARFCKDNCAEIWQSFRPTCGAYAKRHLLLVDELNDRRWYRYSIISQYVTRRSGDSHLTKYFVSSPLSSVFSIYLLVLSICGTGLLNLVSSLTYVSWIRLEASDDGVTYNQSVSEYTMIALAFFDIFLGALGRALGKEG